MYEYIAFTVKLIRESMGLTQAEFAEKVGTSAGHIGSLEQGKAKPSYDLIYEIIKLSNVDANIFFGRTHKEAKPVYEYSNQLMISEVERIFTSAKEREAIIDRLEVIDEIDENETKENETHYDS